MVIWALTAGVGIYLLAVGIAAQRAAGLARASAAAAGARAGSAAAEAADGTDGAAPAAGAQALAVVMSSGPGPAAPPEGSPLLEFSHPALALLGLTFWIFFVMTGDRLFAWIAFGVVVATVAAGLGWELGRRRRAARQRAADGPRFPPHLVLAHGAAAACTFALVVIAAVAAGHG
jgi:hypothetical protein